MLARLSADRRGWAPSGEVGCGIGIEDQNENEEEREGVYLGAWSRYIVTALLNIGVY